MDWLKEIKDRWQKESPDFWKKILSIAITLGTSAMAIIGADQLLGLQAYGVPQVIFTVSGYIVVACAALGLSAKVTKKEDIPSERTSEDSNAEVSNNLNK